MTGSDGTAAPPVPPGWGPWRPPDGAPPLPSDGPGGPVGSAFLAAARSRPDHPAVRSPAGTWSYRELAAEALGVAGALGAHVPGPSPQPVALLARHDGPLVVAVLGIVLAGRVVVVLDPMAPEDQTVEVLRESGAEVLLHDPDHAAAAAALAATLGTSLLDLDGARAAAPADPFHRGHSDPMMLAFTSGTAGTSKGAVITHGVLSNLVRGATAALGIGPDDTMPMLFPTSLAVAAYPMFLPLLNGGTLTTLDVRSVGLEPVADLFATEGITLAYMSPTVVRFLVDALADRSFPAMRLVALGGEVVDGEVLGLAQRLFGTPHVANGFGTTETGVISLHVLEASEIPGSGPVPAGHAVPDVELHVLGDDGAPVGVGVAGEVAVASPHLFSGYWGHPELTERVLLADPEGRTGWGLYRTGDLGRLDADGALTVLGRVDTKVKVRGRFVVLGDVEADIAALDEVEDATVVALGDPGSVELAAVVAPTRGASPTGPALRARLLERREAYRIPSRWHVVDEMPRLPNGKTDRRAVTGLLAGPTPARAGAADAASAPLQVDRAGSPATLRTIRDLWEELLPVPAVAPDDDFLHLGGDSLLAAQMLVHLERRLAVTVPMGELVHARTARQLAGVVDRIAASPVPDPTTAAEVQAGDGSRPRLWFVHDLQGSAYRVRHLAAHLGPDQGVWSFESPLLRGDPNPFTTLDTFAARYVRDLLAAQPEGPYWLAGYSFGGVCAYEMARQMARDGHEVAFVGVVDVGPGYRGPGWDGRRSPLRPWFGIAKPPEEGTPPIEVVRHYASMGRTSPRGLARHLMVRSGLARVVDPPRFRADIRARGRVRPEWRLWYAWEEHWRLAARHWSRTRTYPGSIDLLWADDTASADATMGWGPLVADVRIHRFAGDHIGVLEPRGAVALAEALRGALDAAGAGRPGPVR